MEFFLILFIIIPLIVIYMTGYFVFNNIVVILLSLVFWVLLIYAGSKKIGILGGFLLLSMPLIFLQFTIDFVYKLIVRNLGFTFWYYILLALRLLVLACAVYFIYICAKKGGKSACIASLGCVLILFYFILHYNIPLVHYTYAGNAPNGIIMIDYSLLLILAVGYIFYFLFGVLPKKL